MRLGMDTLYKQVKQTIRQYEEITGKKENEGCLEHFPHKSEGTNFFDSKR